jgi:light-regulated signal transduction histidine kinase (bacteriophytochrome)
MPRMTTGTPSEPDLPQLLSLSAHEFRNITGVIAGYLRMLLEERFGGVNERQRQILVEIQRASHKATDITHQMSELARLERGEATFDRKPVDPGKLLEEAIESLPALPDRDIPVTLTNSAPDAKISADAARLKAAFVSVIHGVRRELADAELLVRINRRTWNGSSSVWIAVATGDQIERLEANEPATLATYRVWNGGTGLALPVARRVITNHHGWVWSAPHEEREDEEKKRKHVVGVSGAVIALPEV